MVERTIELVFIEGCPHVDRARANLRSALASAGGSATWTEWDVGSDATPDRYRRFGSPTVLVNGRDVTGAGRSQAIACRVEGGPSVAAIVAALG